MENTGITVWRYWHYASLLNIHLTTCSYLHKMDVSIMRKRYKFLVKKWGKKGKIDDCKVLRDWQKPRNSQQGQPVGGPRSQPQTYRMRSRVADHWNMTRSLPLTTPRERLVKYIGTLDLHQRTFETVTERRPFTAQYIRAHTTCCTIQ